MSSGLGSSHRVVLNVRKYNTFAVRKCPTPGVFSFSLIKHKKSSEIKNEITILRRIELRFFFHSGFLHLNKKNPRYFEKKMSTENKKGLEKPKKNVFYHNSERFYYFLWNFLGACILGLSASGIKIISFLLY